MRRAVVVTLSLGVRGRTTMRGFSVLIVVVVGSLSLVTVMSIFVTPQGLTLLCSLSAT